MIILCLIILLSQMILKSERVKQTLLFIIPSQIHTDTQDVKFGQKGIQAEIFTPWPKI